jgi:hypothetical protein
MAATRNTTLLISLTVLVLVSSLLAIVTGRDNERPVDPDYFRTVASETIDRVLLRHHGQEIVLSFANNRWRVNDTWDADNQMIKVLFATLRQAEPRRPVAAAQRDTVWERLQREGVQVTVYTQGQEQMKFFAGGNALKTESWFLREGDSDPYLMVIPGYRVYVSGILELDESGWRNKRVFDFNWRNFKSFSASYPGDPAQNFELEFNQQMVVMRNEAAADTAKLNGYLDAVSLLFARRFVDAQDTHADSVVATGPLARLEIRDIADRAYVLELFRPSPLNQEVIGRLGDGQRVALDKADVAELVRKRDYFKLR